MIILHKNFGDIKVQLNEEKAPETSANFLQYCRDGFYDNTLFHRVIDGFMIQGGGMTSGLKEKTTRATIKNEANNGLKNDRGTLAMARTNDPHSASSQFFINLKDNDFLNHSGKNSQGWGYCVFAKISEGMDVVEKMKSVATGNMAGHQDVPKESIVIEKVTISE